MRERRLSGRWLRILTGTAAALSLIAGVLIAMALISAGYSSEIADVAERSLRREGFSEVVRDRDLTRRPCRPFAFIRPVEAVGVDGLQGERARVEVTVLDVSDSGVSVAERLAAGLAECRTADAAPFQLEYDEVQVAGTAVDWSFTATGPVTSSGIARLRRVGDCTIYLTDQRAGTAAVDGARLERVEAALTQALAARDGDCSS